MPDITPNTVPLNQFAIFNGSNDKAAFKVFYQLGGDNAKPLWQGTPYADWQELMPFIACVTNLPQFVSWAETKADEDWGMLVSSPCSPEEVFGHFRSLTQVWLPSGSHAFFRFYDPRFSLSVAQLCDETQRARLMGPCVQWHSGQETVTNAAIELDGAFIEQPFPWWEVPPEVMKLLTEEDKSILIANSLQWLREHCADLYFSYPESIISAKVAYLVQQHDEASGSLNQWLKVSLDKEVYR